MDDLNKEMSGHIEEKQHLDFLTSIVMLIVSISAIIASIGYWRQVGGKFYASPGFMPAMICGALVLMSLLMLKGSLKDSSIKIRIEQLKESFGLTVKSRTVLQATICTLIFAVYVFLLLGRLPFWLASFLGLFFTIVYLKFEKKLGTILKLLLISVLSIAGIVLLFQYIFSVPMP